MSRIAGGLEPTDSSCKNAQEYAQDRNPAAPTVENLEIISLPIGAEARVSEERREYTHASRDRRANAASQPRMTPSLFLRPLLTPASVALVGASSKPGSIGRI